ncbi:hypothetical protein TNCV_3758171 [Trichonephila clavipes]|nr:hypothetical protein TNCV_3758171 [Trichonephila clavipes]
MLGSEALGLSWDISPWMMMTMAKVSQVPKLAGMGHCNGAEVFRLTKQSEAFSRNRFKIQVISAPDMAFRQDTNIFSPHPRFASLHPH